MSDGQRISPVGAALGPRIQQRLSVSGNTPELQHDITNRRGLGNSSNPSHCALVLSGIAGMAAQFTRPGRYTLGSLLDPTHPVPAQIRNAGPDQPLITPGHPPLGHDVWDLMSSHSGGFVMRNVAFGTFLTVASNNSVVTGSPDQATSFSVTGAGSGQFHIGVAEQDSLWTVPAYVIAIFPVPDRNVYTEPANGGQEQLWTVTPAA
ncbi:hypothetical protein BD779DRAFT_1676216 [Infundibulicybe gibba]|nr:hypothetical protein BD779DRAFT_1676216 [Infundibulicybe gibba]